MRMFLNTLFVSLIYHALLKSEDVLDAWNFWKYGFTNLDTWSKQWYV